MASPSLTFLFNVPTDKNTRCVASTIQFGSGLEGFEVLLGKAPYVITKVTAPDVQEPCSQFDLNGESDFPSLKKIKINSTPPARVVPLAKGKEVLYEDDLVNDPAPVYPVFEVGSSSKLTPLTRSQRRNRRRKQLRVQKAQEAKLVSTQTISSVKDEPMETSPHLRGSRFHPLSATTGEESLHKIAARLPSSPRHPVEKRKKSETLAQICHVFERMARKDNCSVSEILRRVGCAVSTSMKNRILEEHESTRQFHRSAKKSREVPPPRISAKLRLGDRIITNDADTRLNTTERKSDKFRSEPRSFPLVGGRRLPADVSYLRTRATVTSLRRTDVINKTPRLQSSVRQEKVWKPKGTNQASSASARSYHPREIPKSKTRIDSPKSNTNTEARHGPPVDLKIIKGDSIEGTLEKLRLDIAELSKEQQKNNENDNSSSMDGMEEGFADVLAVETRNSSSSRDVPPPAETSTHDELRREQIRDEQMAEMAKQLKETMAALAALQSQPQSPLTISPEMNRAEVVHISEGRNDPGPSNRNNPPENEPVQVLVPEKDIQQMVQAQVQKALAQSKGGTSVSKGRPYPEEFDLIQYPKGFVTPAFKIFDGTGNPLQHIAQFRATCCNAGGSDALLCRQFVNSLSGVAFDWYADLPNNSIKTFAELEDLFINRFAGAQHHITIGDLVVERQKPNESLVDYILRWRNLSMKCEPQLQEQHAVGILLKSIQGPIAFMLKGFTIKTFGKLLSKASSLQEDVEQFGFPEKIEKSKPMKTFERKSGTVAAVDKGKQPIQIQAEQPRHDYQSSQQYHQQSFQQKIYQTDGRRFPTITERLNKLYPFKDEVVGKMFRSLLKKPEFRLPEPKKPEEVDKKDHPLYCPYHRMVGHTIENCFPFKNWLEKNFESGNIIIPKEYLRGPE